MTNPVPSLRDRLAAKQRRRVVVRIQVTDPGEDTRAAEQARTFWLAAQATEPVDDERVAELRAGVEAAEAALEAHYVDIPFAAMPPADFEALCAAHQDDTGDTRWRTFLPELAAECVEDESLKDAEWWAAYLYGPDTAVTPGEVQALNRDLFWTLHHPPVRSTVPKG